MVYQNICCLDMTFNYFKVQLKCDKNILNSFLFFAIDHKNRALFASACEYLQESEHHLSHARLSFSSNDYLMFKTKHAQFGFYCSHENFIVRLWRLKDFFQRCKENLSDAASNQVCEI